MALSTSGEARPRDSTEEEEGGGEEEAAVTTEQRCVDFDGIIVIIDVGIERIDAVATAFSLLVVERRCDLVVIDVVAALDLPPQLLLLLAAESSSSGPRVGGGRGDAETAATVNFDGRGGTCRRFGRRGDALLADAEELRIESYLLVCSPLHSLFCDYDC